MLESNRSRAFIEKEFKRILESSNDNFSVGLIESDIFTWEIVIFGPKDTLYESGIFKAILSFPKNFPDHPPSFKFISEMYHPNIDKDGNVCISILHKPGDDEYGYEKLNERWMPVHSPETIIMSIISLLNDPNTDSPANVQAAVEYREKNSTYKKKVLRLTQKTLE